MEAAPQPGALTPETAETFLADCAAHPPDDYQPASEAWGYSVASEALQQAQGTPLYAAMMAVLGQFLREGDLQQLGLAARFADPAVVAADDLIAGYRRPQADETLKERLLWLLGRALVHQPHAYKERHRDLVGRPGWESFVVPYAWLDHAWFVQHLAELFGQGREGAIRFMPLLDRANRSEAMQLRRELVGHRAELGDEVTDLLIDQIDGLLERDALPEGSIRWHP